MAGPFLTWRAKFALLFMAILSLVATASAQALYALNYADSSMLTGASQACLDAYNANVSCTRAIGYLYSDLWPNFNKTCASNVTFYDIGAGSTWPATYRIDQAIYGYNLTCVKRSDGEYCNIWFQTGVGSTTNPECDECYLVTAYMQAESPIDPDPAEMQSIYSSMSSSCQYTGPPATKTLTSLVLASPTGTRTCNSQYTIKAGDTYFSVSQSQNVATHDLVTANGLNYNLTDFPTNGTLCIRNQCSTYVVQANDTCSSIATANSISLAKLHSWNAQINGLCSNLADQVNQTICMSNPLGDAYIVASSSASSTEKFTSPAPEPTNIAPNTNTDCGEYYDVVAGDDCGTISLRYSISLDDFLFLNLNTYPGYATATATFSITPANSTPVPWKDLFAPSNKSVTIIPLANDTQTDCWDYLWWNSSLNSPPSCWSLAISFDIAGEQLVLWNPSLKANATLTSDGITNTPNGAATTAYNYPCTIEPSVSYCVALASPTSAAKISTAPPSPRASGEAAGCTEWFPSILDCASHLSLLRMDLAMFYSLNPSVKPDCSGYVLGTYYCYSTSVDGSVATSNATTTATNTISSSPTITTATPSSTSIITPTPIQSGMISTCNKFYDVQTGDGCWAITNKYGISLNDFYAWNPAVGTDCSGLWPNYYVCVGIEGSRSSSSIPPSSTSTSSSSTSSTLPVSTNGLCGSAAGMICTGSTFGDCCSSGGYCGSTPAYCGGGCQSTYGTCDAGSASISPDVITAVRILITAEVDVRAPTEHAAERTDYFLLEDTKLDRKVVAEQV
ncbi:hypothetical protein CNMCM7691_004806 [Aspergillus felis]|uniref:Carbohydrate-binding module family 18 protein n=1 Tax=Aspergillus felis TaxID=1287682 RepID=A0A8H6R3W3_9EURO|nr:hypothetical protein CNMCM7691_004806 [Aspergillus felis]